MFTTSRKNLHDRQRLGRSGEVIWSCLLDPFCSCFSAPWHHFPTPRTHTGCVLFYFFVTNSCQHNADWYVVVFWSYFRDRFKTLGERSTWFSGTAETSSEIMGMGRGAGMMDGLRNSEPWVAEMHLAGSTQRAVRYPLFSAMLVH